MNKAINIGNDISGLLLTGQKSCITVIPTTMTLWDVLNGQSVKTVMLPPGVTVDKAVSMTTEDDFVVYATTSRNTIIRLSKNSFDYAKALCFQATSRPLAIAPLSTKRCLVVIGDSLGMLRFDTAEPTLTSVCPVKSESIVSIGEINENVYVVERNGVTMISMDSKESKTVEVGTEVCSAVVGERVYLITKESVRVFSPSLEFVMSVEGAFNDVFESDHFLLLTGDKDSQLIDKRYGALVQSMEPAKRGLIGRSIILYNNKQLTTFTLPPKPTLANTLVHRLPAQPAKETRADLYEGTVDGEVRCEELIGSMRYSQLPDMTTLSNKDFEESVIRLARSKTPIQWNLWDIIANRINSEHSTPSLYWDSIKTLSSLRLIRNYTELLTMLLDSNDKQRLLHLIGKSYVTIQDDVLARLLQFALDTKSSPEFNKRLFLLQLINREINSQTAPKMLSKLSPTEVLSLLQFLVGLFHSKGAPKMQWIVNWLMALFDAHITLLVTNPQFVEPLRKAARVIEEQISVTELCESLQPYVQQAKSNLPLPNINKSEYVIVDMFWN